MAVDSVDRRSSAGKLFQVSGPETAKFLQPVAVAVRCTSSFPEAADSRCWTVDVLWDERPASRAQRDTGVLGPADICWPASQSFIVSAGQPDANAVLKGSVWRGRIYGFRWSSAPWRSELLGASEWRNQRLQPVDYCNSLTDCWRKHE